MRPLLLLALLTGCAADLNCVTHEVTVNECRNTGYPMYAEICGPHVERVRNCVDVH